MTALTKPVVIVAVSCALIILGGCVAVVLQALGQLDGIGESLHYCEAEEPCEEAHGGRDE